MGEAGKLLGEAAILTQEAAESLRRYLDDLDIDPARQDEIERRAAALEALARKHRVAVLELPEQLARVEQEVAALDNVGGEPRGPRETSERDDGASIAVQRSA